MNMKTIKPFVSIVIPALNEEESIQLCLDAIDNLEYPKDRFEIVVVDNGSIDGTVSIAKKSNASVHIFPDTKIGKLRNLGVQNARGDVIAFVDADCIVSNDWLNAALDILSANDIGAVGGGIECRKGANWLERAWALDQGEKLCDVTSLATGSFILRRSDFDEVGGFNDDLVAGEDTEISQRLLGAGKKLKLYSKCNVVHLGYPRTMKSFIKRQVWQTSDYLISLKSGLDKTFTMTLMFLISGLGMISFFITDWDFLGLLCLTVMVSVPSVASVFRLKQSAEKGGLHLYCAVFGVQLLYFIGRAIGLTISIYKKITGKYA